MTIVTICLIIIFVLKMTLTINSKHIYKDESYEDIEHLIIGPDVITIYDECFENCWKLESVEFIGCKHIRNYAFRNCRKLRTVIFSETITYIGNSAFMKTGLVNVKLPNSLISMGCCVFQECSSLVSISIDKPIEHIPMMTFYGCSSLISINIDKPMMTFSIGHACFYNCSSLTNIQIPANCLKDSLFSECTNLKTVTLTNIDKCEQTSIPSYCFYNCSSLISFEIVQVLRT